jgi:hypothetical protein
MTDHGRSRASRDTCPPLRQRRWRSPGLAAVACAIGVTGCSPTFDWREQRLGGQGLIVLLPCRPQLDERMVPLGGVPVTMRLAACTAGGLTWAAAEVEPAAGQAPSAAMQALHAAAARNVGAASHEAAASTPDGGGRWTFTGHRADGRATTLRLALLARGRSVVQLSVIGSAAPAGDALDTFFGAPRWAR